MVEGGCPSEVVVVAGPSLLGEVVMLAKRATKERKVIFLAK